MFHYFMFFVFNRIKTKFHVVDPAVEAAQARLDAMRTGRFTASKPKKAPIPVTDKTQLDRSSILDLRSINSKGTAPRRTRPTITTQGIGKSENSVTPLPPPMVSETAYGKFRRIALNYLKLVHKLQNELAYI